MTEEQRALDRHGDLVLARGVEKALPRPDPELRIANLDLDVVALVVPGALGAEADPVVGAGVGDHSIEHFTPPGVQEGFSSGLSGEEVQAVVELLFPQKAGSAHKG